MGVGPGMKSLRILIADFYVFPLKNLTGAKWAGSCVDTAVSESKRLGPAHALLHTHLSFQHPAISVQGLAFPLDNISYARCKNAIRKHCLIL